MARTLFTEPVAAFWLMRLGLGDVVRFFRSGLTKVKEL